MMFVLSKLIFLGEIAHQTDLYNKLIMTIEITKRNTVIFFGKPPICGL